MSQKIIEQKKGLDHVHYIFDVAMEILEKEFKWVDNDLDDCLKLAMKRHRENLPKMEANENKKCKRCGADISIKGLYHCNDSAYCIICWKKTFLS